MSSVSYSLRHRGVRLIDSQEAWVRTKKGGLKLNPKYVFIGKMDTHTPNFILSATDNKKPKYKGSTYDLNSVAKAQIIEHFYNEKGKRNKKKVAYFGIEKKSNQGKRPF